MAARLIRLQPLLSAALLFIGLISLVSHKHSRNPSPENTTESAKCDLVRNFAFLKTHKAGSSTVENILLRFGLKHNLNLVVPAEGNYLSTDQLFSRTILQNAPWRDLKFHMSTLHGRWNYDEMSATVGKEATFFSIIRDPATLFESLYSFLDLEQFYGVDIQSFIDLLSKNETKFDHLRKHGQFGRNQICWDWAIADNFTTINQSIARIDRQLNLVLISEFMDESLILLAEELCWPLEEFAHLNLNKRGREATVVLTQKEREILKNWLAADYALYDYFKAKFDLRLKAFGAKRMSDKLGELKKLNTDLEKKCVLKLTESSHLRGKFKFGNEHVTGYIINRKDRGCHSIAMNEKSFLEIYRSRLWMKAKMAKFVKRNDEPATRVSKV